MRVAVGGGLVVGFGSNGLTVLYSGYDAVVGANVSFSLRRGRCYEPGGGVCLPPRCYGRYGPVRARWISFLL